MKDQEVVEANFVRKDFYIPPPMQGAPVATWNAWLKADRQQAINAKRAHTMSLKAAPENAQKLWGHGSGMPIRGGDGVHRQSTGFVGFESRGGEDAGAEVVAAVAATQDRYFQGRGTKGHVQSTVEQRQSRKAANKQAKRLRLVKG